MRSIVASLGVAFAVQALAQERADVTTQPPPPEARAEGYGKQYGVLGNTPLVFGPKVTFGFPNPVAFGLEAKYANMVGLSFDYGFMPEVTLTQPDPDVKVKWNGWSVGAKLYPFRGAFFLGGSLGGRSFTVNVVESSTGHTYGHVSGIYAAPELGWRWVSRSGLLFGMEFGWQFVLSYTAEYNGIAAAISNDPELQKDVDNLGKAGLPIVGLLTVGYLF